MTPELLDRPGPLVEVQWTDSTGNGGWHDAAEAESLLSKIDCRSVGYLVHESEAGIVIAMGTGGTGAYLYSMAIPRSQLVALKHVQFEWPEMPATDPPLTA